MKAVIMWPFIAFKSRAVILKTFMVPMVYICQFKDLEPLASKQVILSLQAYLNFVLWVFFCW